MRLKYSIIQIMAMFAILFSACQPETSADVITKDADASAASTEEENAVCQQIIYVYTQLGRNGMEGNIVSLCPDGTDKRLLSGDKYNEWMSPGLRDGSLIAFQSDRSGMRQLHLMDPDGSNMRQLTFLAEMAYLDWFWMADGDQIALLVYPAESRGGGSGEEEEEEEEEEDGGSGQEDSSVVEVVKPTWQVVNVVTNEITPLLDWTDDIYFGDLVFSHDGNRMVYLTRSEYVEGIRSTASIHIQNIDGSDDIILISDIWTSFNLAWSPDDSQIAFLIDPVGDYEQSSLYIVNADGSNPQRVTQPIAGYGFNFTWSPDGKSFAIFSEGSFSILDINNGQIRKLFSVDYPNTICCISWQP